MPPIRVIPVLDLKGGAVVRGIAGQRQSYRPIISMLTPSTKPEAVAEAFRDSFGSYELYIADLDAIAGNEPDLQTYRRLRQLGFVLWVDAGIRRLPSARRLRDCGVERMILALETIPDPDTLDLLLCELGGERAVFSVDLQDGRPLGDPVGWQNRSPEEISSAVLLRGVRRLIILDLASVGLGQGPATHVLSLCQGLHHRFPEVEIITGGGVRHREDLQTLEQHGVSAALVASALHDGRLRRADLRG